MLGDTLTVSYNAVNKVLNKVSVGNYTATYYLDDSANHMTFTASVKHTVPAAGASGESHLMRLDVAYFDATTGELLRTESVWSVFRTTGSAQNSTALGYSAHAIVDYLDGGTIIADILARES